jgi:hypothetical protein
MSVHTKTLTYLAFVFDQGQLQFLLQGNINTVSAIYYKVKSIKAVIPCPGIIKLFEMTFLLRI